MEREIRRVPANWQHPKDAEGRFVPLFDGATYEDCVRAWNIGAAKWADGFRDDWCGGWKPRDGTEGEETYADWAGDRPDANSYMPRWTNGEATHYMMYETCSEGTPISPVCATRREAMQRGDRGADN